MLRGWFVKRVESRTGLKCPDELLKLVFDEALLFSFTSDSMHWKKQS